MRRADLLLAGAALAVGLLSFALVRGLQRIVSADSQTAAASDAAPGTPALARPQLELDGLPEAPVLATSAREVERSVAPSDAARAPDPVPGIVWGYLLDDNGRPIEKSGIAFQNGAGERHDVKPDARGAYSIAGLDPGPWWAAARSTGHRTDEQCLEVPLAPTPLRKDFVLRERPRVDVQLLAPDGRPFSEVAKEKGVSTFGLQLVPVATRELPGARFHEIVGSLNNPFGVGQFWQNGSADVSLPQGFFGSVFLDVDPPVYLSLVQGHVVLETRRVETTPAVVALTFDPSELATQLSALRMRLVDADGAPVPGAHAYLGDFNRFPEPESDASGELVVESLPPGRGGLRVMAEGLAMHCTEIELEPGRTLDLGEVVLGPEVLVSGTISGPDGEPLEAEIFIGSLADDGTLAMSEDWCQGSDATGHFELPGLAPGRHVLQVYVQHSSPRYLPNAELLSTNVILDTRAGPVQDLDVRLPRPSRLSVRWASGARKDLVVRFLDERGLPRQWGRFHSAAPQSFTLPPGRWRLEVTDSEKRIVAEREFTLGDDPLELVVGAE